MSDLLSRPIAGRLGALDMAARRRARLAEDQAARIAALREERERLYPYGLPPRDVTPEAWLDLIDTAQDIAVVTGVTWKPFQVRAVAALLADRQAVQR